MLYPQQNKFRNVTDISGLWDFKLDPEDEGEAGEWFLELPQARKIAVPGSWNEQFQDTRDYTGAAWYCTEHVIPDSWDGERIMLRTNSATYGAKVWVNGVVAGEHLGGHVPFEFDITSIARPGEVNRVAIRVENHLEPTRVPPGNAYTGLFKRMSGAYPNTSYDFFPYSGLHRPVLLHTTPVNHIEDVTVVTEIEGSEGIVRVSVKQSGAVGSGSVSLDGENFPAAEDLEFEDGVAQAVLKVPSARLWSPADPYLYNLTVTLGSGVVEFDSHSIEIGIRTIEVRGDQFLLNGEPVFFKGFGRHEDFAIHGRGQNLPLLIKDYSLLKWVGANSYRTSHYPYSEEEMQMADREGVLIIDETPAVGLFFDDGQENIAVRLRETMKQQAELIARDKNHPSVIMWSVANEPISVDILKQYGVEGPAEGKQAAIDFFDELFALVRSLDPTRPVTVVGRAGTPLEWLALSDVVCINRYYGWYSHGGQMDEGRKALEAEVDEIYRVLKKPIIITEFGADTIAGMHSDPPEMFSEEYQVEFLRAYLDVADARDFIIGMHVWNFADFKTGQAVRRPGGMNLKGVFTRDRRPKMAATYLRERWGGRGDDQVS